MRLWLIFLSLICCLEAFGATTTWTNLSGGFWKDGTNWSSGAPNSTLQVSIVNTNSKEVIVDATTPLSNLSIDRLQILGPQNVTNQLTISDVGPANPFSILSSSTGLTVGQGGAIVVSNSTMMDGGSLTISNRGSMRLVNSSLRVDGLAAPFSVYGGSLVMESGSIVVSDPDSLVRIGRSTNGTLTIHGGAMDVAGDMTLGESLNRSSGLLQMTGGSLNLRSFLTLAEGSGSSGTISMTGGELVATNGTNGLLRIGNVGTGQMLLSNATVRATSLSVAEGSPAFFPTGSVSVANSRLVIGETDLMDPNFTNIVRIGDYGRGQMTVSSGGVVLLPNTSVARHTNSIGILTVLSNGFVGFSDDLSIGRFSGSTGTVLVAGGQLVDTNSPIWIGRDGVGQLTITSGLVQTPSLFVAMVPTNTARGFLSINGGKVLVSSNLVLGDMTLSTGQVAMASGSLIITNQTTSAELMVASGNFLFGSGEITTDRLVLTNSGTRFLFGGGTVRTKGTAVSNGLSFIVGDGTNAATLYLDGGTHSFANGLIISSNATLTGCGTIIGTVENHGTISTNCGTVVEKPGITQQPQTQTVTNGGTAMFSVTATGTEPLTYQWRRNGNPITGANSSTLSLSGVQSTNAGEYTVVVSNSAGSATSDGAFLRVLIAPILVNMNYAGNNFTVSFGSESGLNYQLQYKNDLGEAMWHPLGSVTGNANLLQLVDTNTLAPSRFYRILVQ